MSYPIRTFLRLNTSVMPKIALSPRNLNLRLSQVARSESAYAKSSTLKRYSCISLTAGYESLHQQSIRSKGHTPSKHLRHYTTNSGGSGSGGRKFVWFFKGTIRWIFRVIFWIIYGQLVYIFSRLPDWPDVIRFQLNLARLFLEVGFKQDTVVYLTWAWETIQNIPMDTLDPDASGKVLGVAEWLADALEKDNRISEAYDILVEAVEVYESRFRKSTPVPDHTSINAMNDAKLSEKCHLISIYFKLATLSKTCAPGAEETWISPAILEMDPLIPLFKERYGDALSSAFDLAGQQIPTFGCLKEIGAQIRSSGDIPNTGDSGQSSKSETRPSTQGVDDDNTLPLPRWYLSDVSSVVAGLLELVGLSAERHNQIDVALFEYKVAVSVLASEMEEFDGNATLASVDKLIRLLRIRNRITDLELRLLESETDPAQVLNRFFEISRDNLKACRVATRLEKELKILNEKDIKMPLPMTMRKAEAIAESALERAIAMKHKGIRMEKLGELDLALENFKTSLALLERAKGKNANPCQGSAGEFIKPAIATEERKVEEYLEALGGRAKQGNTSTKSHMNLQALAMWEKPERAKSTKFV